MPNDPMAILANELDAAKKAEQEATAARIEIEGRIYSLLASQMHLPATGTVTSGAVKMTLKQTVKWDQKRLAELKSEIPPELFPFEEELVFKPDAHAIKVLAVDHDQVWRKLKVARTTKPAKPAFAVNKERS